VAVSQAKLNQPGRNRGLGNLTECGGCADVHSRREPEYRMVPDIKDIHAELELVAFLNLEVLDHGEVPVLLVWPAESVSRRSAELLDP